MFALTHRTAYALLQAPLWLPLALLPLFSLFFKFSSVFCVFKDLISVSVSHNCRFIFRTFFKPTSGFCIQYLNFLQFFPFINCVTISFIAKTPLLVFISSATILSCVTVFAFSTLLYIRPSSSSSFSSFFCFSSSPPYNYLGNSHHFLILAFLSLVEAAAVAV